MIASKFADQELIFQKLPKFAKMLQKKIITIVVNISQGME